MTDNLLLITIPSYKDSYGLERTLFALTQQTFKKFNVVIIEDKSGEDIREITSKFENIIDIEVIVNNVNLGAMKNMFKSITYNTNFKYVFSLHEDDFIKPNYLEECINILQNNDYVSFAVTTPVWVDAKFPYKKEFIPKNDYELFDASTFVENILNRRQYIFGSVVYRKKDMLSDWDFDTYDIFSDRYFLTKILYENNTKGAEVHGDGIYVRDHTLDKTDKRDSTLKEENGINLITFYRKILLEKYSKKYVDILITNEILFFYNGLKNRGSILKFYYKLKKANIINLISIRALGIFSIMTLPFGPRIKKSLIKIYKTLIRQ